MRQMITIFILSLVLLAGLYAGDEKNKSENINIPELKQMHNAIYPMWHKGYPNKNYNLLKSLYPDLKDQFAILSKAKFPAEYPDRKMHWQEGLEKMELKLHDYKKAIDERNVEDLLVAARAVHDAFEGLVRIINPPIPELDQFHKVLYHAYHDYLPEKNWQKLNESIDQFQEAMNNLNNAKLPKWMSGVEEEFNTRKQNLAQAVAELAALKNSADKDKITGAVETVHTAYIELERVFE
jgi:hypothetical protein